MQSDNFKEFETRFLENLEIELKNYSQTELNQITEDK